MLLYDSELPPPYEKVVICEQFNNQELDPLEMVERETIGWRQQGSKNFWPRKTDACGLILNMSILWHLSALLLVPFSPFNITLDMFLKTGSCADELTTMDFKTLCGMISPYVLMMCLPLSFVVMLPITSLMDFLTPYVLILCNLGICLVMWIIILSDFKLCVCLVIYAILVSFQLAVCLTTTLLVNSLFSLGVVLLVALRCVLPAIPYLSCVFFIHTVFSIVYCFFLLYPGWRDKGYCCVQRFGILGAFSWISFQTIVFPLTFLMMMPMFLFATIKSPILYQSLIAPVWWISSNCGVWILSSKMSDLMPSKKFNMVIFAIMWIEWGFGMYVLDQTLIFYVWPAWSMCFGFVRICILDTLPLDNVLFAIMTCSLGLAFLLV